VAIRNRELMKQARQDLKGKWGIAAIGTLIYFLTSLGIDHLPVIGSVLSYVLDGVLTVGYTAFILAVIRNQDIKYELLFYGLSRFITALLTGVLVLITVGLWCLPTAAGATVMFVIFKNVPHNFIPVALFVLLCIITVIVALKVLYRYSIVYFLIVDSPQISALETLKLSREIMLGNKWKNFCLDCRFIGWFLLGICLFLIVLGTLSLIIAPCTDCVTGFIKNEKNIWKYDVGFVGFLWILPYWKASISHFYENVKQSYDEKQASEHTDHVKHNETVDFLVD